MDTSQGTILIYTPDVQIAFLITENLFCFVLFINSNTSTFLEGIELFFKIRKKKKRKALNQYFPGVYDITFPLTEETQLMEFLIRKKFCEISLQRKTVPWGKVPSQCEKPHGRQCSLWKFKSAFMGENWKDLLYLTQKFIKKEKR